MSGRIGPTTKKAIIATSIILVFIVGIIIVKMANKPPAPPPPKPEKPKPVYEVTIGDIKVSLVKAVDLGNRLKASDVSKEFKHSNIKDRVTTEKFIEVVVEGQNIGKETTPTGAWDIGNIIDEKGRIFQPLSKNEVSFWLPENNNCQMKLKPGFTPSLCAKIYEVAKISKKLKVEVLPGSSAKKEKKKLIDLKLEQAMPQHSFAPATSTTSSSNSGISSTSVDANVK